MSTAFTTTRRGFLKTSATVAGGLLVGFSMPVRALAQSTSAAASKLNAWVHVAADDTVTLFIHKAEMGQGTMTSLAQLLAEELECDWKKVRTEFPGVDPVYGNQGVFGSQSIRGQWTPLRTAGATAREMLVSAAAQRWNVDRAQCRAENGFVVNGAGQRLSYGALADAASTLQAPANVALKERSAFKIIGTRQKRLDTPAKVDGSAVFGIDFRLPNMLYGVVARSPVFGGTLKSFDDTKARAVPGVKHVMRVSTGVAILADNTWSALQARRVLDVTWDEGANANVSSASIRAAFVDLASRPGLEARKEGDAAAALSSATNRIEAVYEAPYAAHALMEPLACVADVRADSCEVWASTQAQTFSQATAAKAADLPPNRVKVHSLFIGSGLGRRTRLEYVAETVEAAKAAGVPVKITWSREDDLHHDAYRPAAYVKFAGAVDAAGWPVALTARIVCPSFGFGGGRGGNGVDHTAVEGIEDLAYAIPNMMIDFQRASGAIPTHYWRSVGYSQNTFFAESFIDELAAAGKKDPLELRRRLLAKSPRMLGVLNLAAEKAGWGTPLPAGRARGISVVNNIGSFTAQVAEISIARGVLKIHRVVCAVDCGHTVNPAIIEQQIAGGIGTGLTAALKDAITIEKGRVVQNNFNDYRMSRMGDMPPVEVHLVASTEAPGGIGEASTPGIAPALANAIFALTGKRIRTLPIKPADLV